MRLRNLQSLLEGFEGPPESNVDLEQYPTPLRLAAEVVFNAANLHDAIAGKVVAALGCGCGCGCGILSIAALCMGAAAVHSVDIDPLSIEAARHNLNQLSFDEPPAITFYEQDVRTRLVDHIHVDTVVMNLPFGTRNRGRDLEFLSVAGQIASGNIFSFHKTATRRHVLDVASPKLRLKGEVMEVDFDLKKLYRFHKVDSKPIKVDVWRFWHVAK
jgi:predicted RNA methylase